MHQQQRGIVTVPGGDRPASGKPQMYENVSAAADLRVTQTDRGARPHSQPHHMWMATPVVQ